MSRHGGGATAITKFESEILGLLHSLPGGEATTRTIVYRLAPVSMDDVVAACQRLAGCGGGGRITCRWSDDGLERTWRVTS